MRLTLPCFAAACLIWASAFIASNASGQTAPAGVPQAATPAAPAPSTSGRTAAPPGAVVYLGSPQDGATIRSTHFKVWFGARNIGVAPAGVAKAGTGHHHLLIDTALPDDMSAPIPNDKNHLHFGAGQTETVLELPPGSHTLQLLMGDAGHVPHDPPVYSRRISIRILAPATSKMAGGRS